MKSTLTSFCKRKLGGFTFRISLDKLESSDNFNVVPPSKAYYIANVTGLQ